MNALMEQRENDAKDCPPFSDPHFAAKVLVRGRTHL